MEFGKSFINNTELRDFNTDNKMINVYLITQSTTFWIKLYYWMALNNRNTDGGLREKLEYLDGRPSKSLRISDLKWNIFLLIVLSKKILVQISYYIHIRLNV